MRKHNLNLFYSFFKNASTAALAAALVFSLELPPDMIKNFSEKNKHLNPEQAKQYLEYVHPPAVTPYGKTWYADDVFIFSVPQEPANRKLAEMGMIDITSSPFNADPKGRKDSTQAIQAAVDFARDRQMVCFFPSGTYLLSDSITCLQKLTLRKNAKLSGGAQYPCVLTGSSLGKRPVLILAPKSSGFTDPAKRKVFIHFVNCNASHEIKPENGPLFPQANINYNQIFRNIDITIGEGNSGAIGIRMQAAEGSSIQDVTIDARSGHTGMQGAAGSGGSHHNITVIGGRVGIDTRGFPPQFSETNNGTQPGPTMTLVRLKDQTETAFYNVSTCAFTGVGWHIKAKPGKPAIINDNTTGNYQTSLLSLIDSIIEFESPGENLALDTDQGAYFENVYVHNAKEIIKGVPSGSGWQKVRLVYKVPPLKYKGKNGEYDISQPAYINGKKSEFIPEIISAAPPAGLIEKHIWNDNFPSWETPGAVNVKEKYGAKGDGKTDDTLALQKAVNENEIVFLPKGVYRVTDTINLRPKTKLIGIAFHLSVIMAYAPFGKLDDLSVPKPVISTADDANAETIIAFIGIQVAKEAALEYTEKLGGKVPCYALLWRCGEKSIVRSPYIKRIHDGTAYNNPGEQEQKSLEWKHPFVIIEGNGGGKWYNFFIHGFPSPDEATYRHILIRNTKNSLGFYQLHAQHSEGDSQCEIINSRNIRIFGVKTECDNGFLRIKNSSDIRIYGHSGWGSAFPQTGLYTFEDSDDYLISCFGGFIRDVSPAKSPYKKYGEHPFIEWYPINEIIKGKANPISPFERPLLLMRKTIGQ
ncbi:MAG TPA: hypothetical protein DC049_12980 [Spirochaetia bacterium]|nr:hypothetical protein [Spirochaetia bacterium]